MTERLVLTTKDRSWAHTMATRLGRRRLVATQEDKPRIGLTLTLDELLIIEAGLWAVASNAAVDDVSFLTAPEIAE